VRFEWDEEKRAGNWLKHRVEFELAATVFNDPLAVMRLNRIEGDEERWMILGNTPGRSLLSVVHTLRVDDTGQEVVRIISARKATAHERHDYSEGRHQDD